MMQRPGLTVDMDGAEIDRVDVQVPVEVLPCTFLSRVTGPVYIE